MPSTCPAVDVSVEDSAPSGAARNGAAAYARPPGARLRGIQALIPDLTPPEVADRVGGPEHATAGAR